jgi:hypothetical protein
MQTQIDQDARLILRVLAAKPRDEFIAAGDIAKETGLDAGRVDDAVALLVDAGHAEWIQTFGTAPFNFAEAYITSRGRYENQRLSAAQPTAQSQNAKTSEGMAIASAEARPVLPPTPAGSPYGFTDEDWEAVSRHKARVDRLYVVLGHQFSSSCFDSDSLRKNVAGMFESAVQRYNDRRRQTTPVKLKFSVLTAGYGEHLFNQIARGIIGADIAVFETSDLNANVMLEMGVALTWGVRVLPIKVEGKPTPPSDVSGQTWADYRESGADFLGLDHEDKLVAMIERALRKKGPAV